MYILDIKTNLASIIVPTNNDSRVTIYSELEVIPENFSQPQLAIYNSGQIALGNSAVEGSNIVINAGSNVNFKQIFGNNTDFPLTINEYAIEIISDTYNTVTLPSALNIGGRSYLISRGSNNNNLVVRCQPGENIDTRNQIQLKRKNEHIQVMANGQDSWYII